MFWGFSAQSSWRSLLKTLKLAVWALSLNFLHDFTLLVIDIHQNKFISLFLTPFIGLEIFTFSGKVCARQLTICRMQYARPIWNILGILVSLQSCCARPLFPWCGCYIFCIFQEVWLLHFTSQNGTSAWETTSLPPYLWKPNVQNLIFLVLLIINL